MRSKGKGQGRIQNLAMFPNVNTYSDCPLFNIAAHAFTTSTIEDFGKDGEALSPRIFTGNNGNKSGIAAYANAILKPFCEKFGLLVTSHSFRHTSVDIASEHFMVQMLWVIMRGDWSMDSLNTFFEYLAFSSKNDRKVARALAGWSDVNRGTS
jgi:hypothetical protein